MTTTATTSAALVPAPVVPVRSAALGVADLEVGAPLPVLTDLPPLGVRCLVRLAGRPVGVVDLAGDAGHAGRLGPDELAAAIGRALGPALVRRAAEAGAPTTGPLTAGGLVLPPTTDAPAEAPGVTVVIATRDRPDALSRCLDSLVAARPAPAAVVVVDNAPSDERTRDLVARRFGHDSWVTYLVEPRPGLGRAHNAALPVVSTPVVAFTDDDVVVDPGWVGAIADAFEADPEVACVTGLIAPAELLTREQWWVERASGFAKGYEPRVRSLGAADGEGPLFPYDAGTFGSGANMAFATEALRRAGGFDPALGAGTTALGGDDLAALHRVVADGHRLAYEPAAIVFHRHHADLAALERQAYGYGAGLTAYLAHVVAHRPSAALAIGRRALPGVARVLRPTSDLNARRPSDYPTRLVWRERAGMLTGPSRYLRQRLSDRRHARLGPIADGAPAR
jgi:GT2 family glycosyltransferase